MYNGESATIHQFCDVKLTTYSADNYAWMLVFNYLKKQWNWRTDGAWHWPHDELRRSIIEPRSSKNSTNSTLAQDFEQDAETLVDSSALDPDDEPAPANCHQVGSDPLNVACVYMDEDYSEWTSEHGSSTRPASSTSLAPSSTYSPLPTCTASSDCSGHCGSRESVCWDSYCKCGPPATITPTP
ncbi:hypothetical protein N7474_008663 [Penicillium riverlandense]|uniref:uncharacterized protein n=1 Tax=Penicillium riverlandense TaxID=1903569 RepID=UPI0025481B44|nr:uncharacterized protein N7474_008663 [Penicillium riverlandense]KAJ5812362.1 hypothetical protein N7474_008663 [Penicillium riverlandense]